MGTSAAVSFLDSSQGPPVATVILHNDGYPDGDNGVLMELQRFFARIEENASNDKRFRDPEVLAARLVVWLGVWESTALKKDALALNGVSVATIVPSVEHTYFVHCYKDAILQNGAGRPLITMGA